MVRAAGLEATSFGEPSLAGTGRDATDAPYPRARRPSGGLVSTVDDLLRFGEWQLAERRTEALRVVAGKPVGGVYGLGFAGERVGGVDVWGHGGSYGGFQSSLLLVPSRRAVFVGLTNSGLGAQALREVEDVWFQRLLSARRRVPEAISLAASELSAFAGSYANPELRAGVVVAREGLSVTAVALDRATGEPTERLELHARPIGPRTFEVVGGDFDRDRFDFPLPGFARFGSRLAERSE